MTPSSPHRPQKGVGFGLFFGNGGTDDPFWPGDRREGVGKQSGRTVVPPSLSEDRISPVPVTGLSCESVRPHTAGSLPPLRIVYQKE